MLKQLRMASIIALHDVEPLVVLVGSFFQRNNFFLVWSLGVEQIDEAGSAAYFLVGLTRWKRSERITHEVTSERFDPRVNHHVDLLRNVPKRKILEVDRVELVGIVLGHE